MRARRERGSEEDEKGEVVRRMKKERGSEEEDGEEG